MFTASDDPPIGLPFGNTTHQTSSTGAFATFRFRGIFSFIVLTADLRQTLRCWGRHFGHIFF